EKIIKDNNLEKNIFLIGRIAHKDLIYYFNASEIFVLNSEYEGLSHVLIEAMTCNLPIIASDKGGNKEVIKNMHNGMLVEYNNSEKWKQAILKLLNDEDLRKKFIDNSARDLKKFEYSEMINKTENFLTKNL
ncbi:glycosyltransferase family 4 protein, partial [bacterium]|nr:glycosyltransferase family 4 protein [bacterium]